MKAGTIRTVAITSLQRVAAVPDVPTVAESGYPGFETTTWYGILVPAATPPAVVNRLSAAVTKVLAAQDVRDRMAANGGTFLRPPSNTQSDRATLPSRALRIPSA